LNGLMMAVTSFMFASPFDDKAERLRPLLPDLDGFGQHHDERALVDRFR
jgi:hypothetical protein